MCYFHSILIPFYILSTSLVKAIVDPSCGFFTLSKTLGYCHMCTCNCLETSCYGFDPGIVEVNSDLTDDGDVCGDMDFFWVDISPLETTSCFNVNARTLLAVVKTLLGCLSKGKAKEVICFKGLVDDWHKTGMPFWINRYIYKVHSN